MAFEMLSDLRDSLMPTDSGPLLRTLGIVLLLGVQTIINMGVVLGLLPTKGMPLPFVSYGGTSLVMNLTAMGILLSVSSHADFKST